MGDISEMRGLIVLFTIVSVTITLILLIPPAFYTATIDEATQPSDYNPSSFIDWNSTANMTLNDTGAFYYSQQSINGYNWGATVYFPFADDYLVLQTYAQYGPFFWDYDTCDWYVDGVDVTTITPIGWHVLALSTVDSYDSPLKLTAQNSKTKITVTIAYNTTYPTLQDAFEDQGFTLVFNSNWEDRTTSMNALSLVGMVLTGSLPTVHPYLSVVFGFIGWGLIAAGVYLAFIFVLRLVGAVFGGGGA